MCVVSMVMNDWIKPGSPNYPWATPYAPWDSQPGTGAVPINPVGRQEVADLAKLMKQALEILQRIDEKTGAKDCAVEKKVKDDYLQKLQKLIDEERKENPTHYPLPSIKDVVLMGRREA